MQAIETTIENIVKALTTDSYSFYYGKKFDQNYQVDEMVLPCVLLDTPLISNDNIPKFGTYIEPVVDIALVIGYKHSTDDNNIELPILKAKAWSAAKEIVNRLRRDTDNVKTVTNMKRTDFTNVFDVNLSGCMLEIRVTFKDDSSSCTI